MSSLTISSISGGFITINGSEYATASLETGNRNNTITYTLSGNDPIFNWPADKVVLQKTHPLETAEKKVNRAMHHQELANRHVRVPALLFHEGDNLLLEKTTPITISHWKRCRKISALSKLDKRILDFAKRILEKNEKSLNTESKEHVTNFYPFDVGLNSKRMPTVTCFSKAQRTRHNLFEYLKAWSQNNKVIFNYLTKNFSLNTRLQLEELWKNR